jgi:hypothetical protein
LAFSPDGQRLAVGRYDGSLSLFDTGSGKRVAEMIAPAPAAPKREARRRDAQKASQ